MLVFRQPLNGFYLLYQLDAWPRFSLPGFWWLHAMVLVWAIFTLMLFVLEPLILRRLFLAQAARHPDQVSGLIQTMHWVLLALSLITFAGATAGSHGWLWL